MPSERGRSGRLSAWQYHVRVPRVALIAGLACGCLAACGGTPSPPPSPGPNPAPRSVYPASCPGQEPHSPTTAPTVAAPAQIQLPLHAEQQPGSTNPVLVDGRGHSVKLVGVNWYGAESPDLVPGGLDKQPATSIAHEIKQLHFNSVRLPFSDYIVECNPVVAPALIQALKPPHQLRALEVYDQVVAALAKEGLMVVLDNHSSDPTWSPDQNDALWHANGYSTDQWIRDWIAMAQRYRGVPSVIGADLRNEPNDPAEWGTGPPESDWRQAAERAGNAVLSSSGNPNLLVMVEGIKLGIDLAGVSHDPICLQPGQTTAYSGINRCPPGTASNSLVYAPHDYTQSQPADVNSDPTRLTERLDNEDGWSSAAALAPVWIGEFGTCNTTPRCVRANANSAPPEECANTTNSGPVGTWFANFTEYVAQRDYSWAYWSLNGTQSTGGPTSPQRDRSQTECYGLLDRSWAAPPPSAAELICALQSMINPSAATYPADGCAKGTAPPSVPQTGGATTSTVPTSPSCGPSPCGSTNGVTVIITSVKRTPTNYYGEDLTSKGRFLVRMGVRIINKGNESIAVDNYHFGLLDSKHIVDSTSDEGYGSRCGLTGNGDPGLTLAPGADVTMSESLCFEPRGSMGSSFVVALALGSGGEVDVTVP
jgi:endoglucanase